MKWREFRLVGLALLVSCSTKSAMAVTCSLAVSPMSFGSYNPLGSTATDVVANIQVTCTTTVSLLVNYTIGLSAGTGTLRDRRLRSDRFSLAYQIYTDSARSQIWGDGTSGTSMNSNGYLLGALASIATNLIGYGRIPAKQNVGPGGYMDTLIVTVTY